MRDSTHSCLYVLFFVLSLLKLSTSEYARIHQWNHHQGKRSEEETQQDKEEMENKKRDLFK